jgi:hypothetical protein
VDKVRNAKKLAMEHIPDGAFVVTKNGYFA